MMRWGRGGGGARMSRAKKPWKGSTDKQWRAARDVTHTPRATSGNWQNANNMKICICMRERVHVLHGEWGWGICRESWVCKGATSLAWPSVPTPQPPPPPPKSLAFHFAFTFRFSRFTTALRHVARPGHELGKQMNFYWPLSVKTYCNNL